MSRAAMVRLAGVAQWFGILLMVSVAIGAPRPIGGTPLALREAGWRQHHLVAAPVNDELSALPIIAQAAVSRTVGRDNPRYHVLQLGNRIEAENAQHGFAATFTDDGVSIRTEAISWRFALSGYGYGEKLEPVERVAPQPIANTVEYRRTNLTESYVNGPLGLQQVFILKAPPRERAGPSTPLTLALVTSPNPALTLSPSRGSLTLSGPSERRLLRYGGLAAYDAAGRELPAWIEVNADRFYLRVEDTGAQYPLLVDPFVQEAKLTASDGAPGDFLAYESSVAIDGNTVVVGALQYDIGSNANQGAAYVFTRPSGSWVTMTETAKLTASDGAAGDLFGVSVAISGNTIVVGASSDDIGSNANQGSAYVFVRPSGGWVTTTETAKLTASDGAAGDLFGVPVAISGNTIVVGAYSADIAGNDAQGAAYVFARPGGSWVTMTETAKLTASDGADGDTFGVSVAISGNTIVVGAYSADIAGHDAQGAAYVFTRPHRGWVSMTETAKLTASDGAKEEVFGISVAIDGNTIVVGARLADIGGNTGQGAVYIFVRPHGSWVTITETAKLVASDGTANDQLGAAVAIDGNTIVVGAFNDSIGTSIGQGSAYIFERPGGGWAGVVLETTKLTASDGAANDWFGLSVAIDGNTIVVGAPHDDIGGDTDQGSAYIFVGP